MSHSQIWSHSATVYSNTHHKHINVFRPTRMSEYLRTLWSMLAPFKEESLPLISNTYDDLEACANPSDSIVLVCEIPEVAAYARAQHARVGPSSDDYF